MTIADIQNPWRSILLSQPASFRGVIFHVESASRNSGRRIVTHEYPKRNDPYAEDMGRSARRFAFTGYLIYRPSNAVYEYTSQRKRLYSALEQDDVGTLVHPVFCPGGLSVACEKYGMVETRDRGGFTSFDMQFVEAGTPGNLIVAANTVAAVTNAVTQTNAAASQTITDITIRPPPGGFPAPSPQQQGRR